MDSSGTLARFLLISLIAFGGGQAALPLVEQMADSSAQSIAGRFTLSFTSTRQIWISLVRV